MGKWARAMAAAGLGMASLVATAQDSYTWPEWPQEPDWHWQFDVASLLVPPYGRLSEPATGTIFNHGNSAVTLFGWMAGFDEQDGSFGTFGIYTTPGVDPHFISYRDGGNFRVSIAPGESVQIPMVAFLYYGPPPAPGALGTQYWVSPNLYLKYGVNCTLAGHADPAGTPSYPGAQCIRTSGKQPLAPLLISAVPVPEPGTGGLVMAGLVAAWARARRAAVPARR